VVNESAADAPALSVIVTVVEGARAVRPFLEALAVQAEGSVLEIVVPFDATIREVGHLQSAFPDVTFLDLGVVPTERETHAAAGQHELYDRRRAAGLALARGRVIAILEDRGIPRRDWVSSVLRLHERLPHAVIGGAIEPAGAGILSRAYHLCDFGRYTLPFESGPVQWVSDVNVSYKRRALEATRDLWKERYHEPKVHWALLERGETLYLSAEMVVDHRREVGSLGGLLRERFHWGRLFGVIRAAHLSTPKRLLYILSGPLIPLKLLIRNARAEHRKGRLSEFVRAVPAMALLLSAWTLGEVWGYITRRS
jgi:hypothetical protein